MSKTEVKNFLPTISFLISFCFIKVQFSQPNASFGTTEITYNFNNTFLLFQFNARRIVPHLYNGTYVAYYEYIGYIYSYVINLLSVILQS